MSTTVDLLMARHGLNQVAFLSVDTEGWDSAVLRGASKALKARRITVLEFEFNSMGLWLRQPGQPADFSQLRNTTQMLRGFGYRCFWQGNSGALAPLEPWCDGFATPVWSNIVCSHVPGILESFDSLAV